MRSTLHITWAIIAFFTFSVITFPLQSMNSADDLGNNQRQSSHNIHRDLSGKDFTAYRSYLMPFYQKVMDPEKCFIQQWKYFRDNKWKFVGEPGGDKARETLLKLRGKISNSSESFFNGLAKLNHIPKLKVQPDSYITVDVGANIGQGSEFIQKLIPLPHCESYYFEPNPANWQQLKENLKGSPNSHIVTLACGQSLGTMIFDASEKNNTSGNQHGQLLLSNEHSLNPMTVDVVQLDHYFSADELKDRPVLYLKTDAEGYDSIILRGARTLLSRTRFVIFECHLLMKDGEYRGPGTTHYETMQLFSSLGFDVFKLSPQQWVLFTEDFYNEILDDVKYMNWHNCIAVHRTDPLSSEIFRNHNQIPWCRIRPQ